MKKLIIAVVLIACTASCTRAITQSPSTNTTATQSAPTVDENEQLYKTYYELYHSAYNYGKTGNDCSDLQISVYNSLINHPKADFRNLATVMSDFCNNTCMAAHNGSPELDYESFKSRVKAALH